MEWSCLGKAIQEGRERISVIGLGYVGLPAALVFAQKGQVIGFDVDPERIRLCGLGIDTTGEAKPEDFRGADIRFTCREEELREARFHIVAVPTPVHPDRTPDLSLVENASRLLGRNLSRGSVVVYESTVCPGVTEELCGPILEKTSGLRLGEDFKLGYSPERINPGDHQHRLGTVRKIVSGQDEDALELIAQVYGMVSEVYRAPSIRVAEAAKLAENTQRDVNIAFMNELAQILHRLGLDTRQVAEAMDTKWNALGFRPGLVGGHCIGVDPYYLLYQAEGLGLSPGLIAAGREINEGMADYVAEAARRLMEQAGLAPNQARIAVLGFTFKENCPDIRNTRVYDLINALREYGAEPIVSDPLADPKLVRREYGISLTPLEQVGSMDGIILAVPHRPLAALTADDLRSFLRSDTPPSCQFILDIKSALDPHDFRSYQYWRL